MNKEYVKSEALNKIRESEAYNAVKKEEISKPDFEKYSSEYFASNGDGEYVFSYISREDFEVLCVEYIDPLQKELSKLKEENEKFEKVIKELSSAHFKTLQENSDLKARETKFIDEIEGFDILVPKLKDENERLKSIISGKTFFDEKLELNKEIESLKYSLNQSENMVRALKKAYNEAQEEAQKEIESLKAFIKKQNESVDQLILNNTTYHSKTVEYEEEIEILKGKLNKINDEIGKASIPEYGDCKITAKSIGVIIGLTL